MLHYWKSPLVITIVGIICLVIGGVAVWWLVRPTIDDPMPSAVSSQLEFSPFVIDADSDNPRATDYSTTTVEDGTRVLTYTITTDGQRVSVSQYPQPPQFTEVTDFQSKFLENTIQQTSTVSTASGVIILGQMAKQENRQMAVMLERGLIVFFAPDQPLDESQWRMIGDHLVAVRPSN